MSDDMSDDPSTTDPTAPDPTAPDPTPPGQLASDRLDAALAGAEPLDASDTDPLVARMQQARDALRSDADALPASTLAAMVDRAVDRAGDPPHEADDRATDEAPIEAIGIRDRPPSHITVRSSRQGGMRRSGGWIAAAAAVVLLVGVGGIFASQQSAQEETSSDDSGGSAAEPFDAGESIVPGVGSGVPTTTLPSAALPESDASAPTSDALPGAAGTGSDENARSAADGPSENDGVPDSSTSASGDALDAATTGGATRLGIELGAAARRALEQIAADARG